MSRFQPVILGGDLGAYSLARQFHDAYGVKPLLVTAFDPLAIRDSAILERHHFEHADQEGPLVDELLRLGERYHREDPELTLVLVANTEWRVQVLATNRQALEQHYVVPVPSAEVLAEVNDKEVFERLATAQGMKVPLSFYQDFSGADDPTWEPEALPEELTFPVVAKPAASAGYEQLTFEGRKKVYRIDSPAELEDLWRRLREAGFRDRFIVQQLIEGDDTAMYICVAYVDSRGETTLVCSGRVLLEEHDPSTIGNPCAILVEHVEQVVEPVRRLLGALEYRGFANFDIKRDARTGEFYFLEQNPRMGRSSFYCVGAGVNPMELLVSDVVEGRPATPVLDGGRVLYTILPVRMVLRYLRDPRLRASVRSLARRGRVLNPLRNPADASPRRRLYRRVWELSQWRKFRRFYPEPTSTGF